MKGDILIVVGGILLVIIVIWGFTKMLGSHLRGLPKATEQEILQREVNRMASGSDAERALGLGRTVRRGGCLALIAIIIALLWLFSQR